MNKYSHSRTHRTLNKPPVMFKKFAIVNKDTKTFLLIIIKHCYYLLKVFFFNKILNFWLALEAINIKILEYME